MKSYLTRRTTMAIALFISLLLGVSSVVNASEDLPPILDFYPVCEYKIIDSVVVRSKLVKYEDEIEITPRLMKELQQKAKEVEADAVIVTKRDLKKANKSKRNKKPLLLFTADLLNDCDDLTADNQRPTAINSDGKQTIASWGKKVTLKATQIKLPTISSTLRPVISNSTVSLSDGIYGVQLGETYQSILTKLGSPNVVLNIFENELVIGYGRRHWFHFQSDQLVKVTTQSSLITSDNLNRIPPLDFFDDLGWKINGKISHLAKLEKVTQALNILKKSVRENKIVIQNGDSQLALYFSTRRHERTREKLYGLVDFSLQNISYQQSQPKKINTHLAQNRALNHLYQQLNSDDDFDRDESIRKIGQPIGRIIQKRATETLIYNNHLLIESREDMSEKLFMTEQIFKSGIQINDSAAPWQLGNLTQGKSISVIKKLVSEDAYESEYDIELEADNYQLTLMFTNQDNRKILQEAELVFY